MSAKKVDSGNEACVRTDRAGMCGILFFIGGILSALLFCAIVLICCCFVCRHPRMVGITVIICATVLLVTYAVSLLILAVRWMRLLQKLEEQKREYYSSERLMHRISDVYVEQRTERCTDCRCGSNRCENFREKE